MRPAVRGRGTLSRVEPCRKLTYGGRKNLLRRTFFVPAILGPFVFSSPLPVLLKTHTLTLADKIGRPSLSTDNLLSRRLAPLVACLASPPKLRPDSPRSLHPIGRERLRRPGYVPLFLRFDTHVLPILCESSHTRPNRATIAP